MPNKIDFTNKKIARWTVLNETSLRDSSGSILWACECDCGTLRNVSSKSLKNSKSCGCLQKEIIANKFSINLTSKVFGRLKVKAKTEKRNSSGRIMWRCLCDCGNKTTVSSSSLLEGLTKSCSCLGKEKRLASNTKHSMSKTSIYKRWEAIIQRCTNPKDKGFKNYGGRGISVCDAWRDFIVFFEDMGNPPFYGATIDRIDNNKGYYKENCEWTDYGTQIANTRCRKDNKTRYKCVSRIRNKYKYQIVKNGIKHSSTGFKTAKEAFIACEKIRKKLYNRKTVTD